MEASVEVEELIRRMAKRVKTLEGSVEQSSLDMAELQNRVGPRPREKPVGCIQSTVLSLERRAIKLEETETHFRNVLALYGNDLSGLIQATGQSLITDLAKLPTPMSAFYNRFTKKLPGDVLIQEINSLNRSIDNLKLRDESLGAQQGS